MKNSIFLERASKLQKEYAEIYQIWPGLAGIDEGRIHVMAKKFHELERENLLEYISKVLDKDRRQWDHEAMTPQGVKIIALEYVDQMEGK